MAKDELSAPSPRWRRRWAMAGAPRSSTSWRRARDRSTSSPRRSVRAWPIRRSTCRCSRRLGSCGRREGARVFYRPSSGRVVDLDGGARRRVRARGLVEVLAEAYLGDRSEVEHVSMHDLAARLADGSVVLLDVRPRAEYRAGHVPDAVSAPIDELAGRVSDLPGGVEVVAYCRGPYCVYADDAVRLLAGSRTLCSTARCRFPEWRRAGLPVAVSA